MTAEMSVVFPHSDTWNWNDSEVGELFTTHIKTNAVLHFKTVAVSLSFTTVGVTSENGNMLIF